MKARNSILLTAAGLILSAPFNAAALEALHSSCSVSASDHPGKFRLRMGDENCLHGDRCGHISDNSFDRLSGITLADLSREGAQLTARIEAEPGTFICSGTAHNGWLDGQSTFTPNEDFVRRMGQIGFNGLDSEKLLVYTLFDVNIAWIRSLQGVGVSGITIDNIIALRIFHIDPDYVGGFTSLGYKTPDADKLIALKVQGVNAQEVRAIRDLGYQPTLDEMIQIRIFKITPEFIRSMKARGFHDLTIAKLVQIKIFKVDE